MQRAGTPTFRRCGKNEHCYYTWLRVVDRKFVPLTFRQSHCVGRSSADKRVCGNGLVLRKWGKREAESDGEWRRDVVWPLFGAKPGGIACSACYGQPSELALT
jgi:hypothetical protein